MRSGHATRAALGGTGRRYAAHLATRIEQHVPRLDVPMDHFQLPMQVVEPTEKIATHACKKRLRKRAMATKDCSK